MIPKLEREKNVIIKRIVEEAAKSKGPKGTKTPKEKKESKKASKVKLTICGMDKEDVTSTFDFLSSLKLVKGTVDYNKHESVPMFRNLSKLKALKQSHSAEYEIKRESMQLLITALSPELLEDVKRTVRDLFDSFHVVDKELKFSPQKFHFLSFCKKDQVASFL